MKLKIKVDKECLEASKNCRTDSDTRKNMIGQNCAIGKAIHDIFPNSWVASDFILFYEEGHDILLDGMGGFRSPFTSVNLPREARIFITQFDLSEPEERVNMPEIEFEIDIPEKVIETIGDMEEVKRIISTSRTLELI